MKYMGLGVIAKFFLTGVGILPIFIRVGEFYRFRKKRLIEPEPWRAGRICKDPDNQFGSTYYLYVFNAVRILQSWSLSGFLPAVLWEKGSFASPDSVILPGAGFETN